MGGQPSSALPISLSPGATEGFQGTPTQPSALPQMATVAVPFWSNRPVCHNNNNNNYVKVRPAGVWPPTSGGSVRVSQVEPLAKSSAALSTGGAGVAMAGVTDLGDTMPPVAASNAQVLVPSDTLGHGRGQDGPLYNSGTKSPSLLCVVLDD